MLRMILRMGKIKISCNKIICQFMKYFLVKWCSGIVSDLDPLKNERAFIQNFKYKVFRIKPGF